MILLSLLIWLCSPPVDSIELKAASAFRQSGRVCCAVVLGGEPAVGELDTGAVSVSVRHRENDDRFSSLHSHSALVMTVSGPTVFTEYEGFPVEIFGLVRLVSAKQQGTLAATAAGTTNIVARLGNTTFRQDVLRINVHCGVLDRVSDTNTLFRSHDAQLLPLRWSHKIPWVSMDLPVFGKRDVVFDTGSNAFLTLKPQFIEQLLRARQAVYLKETLLASPKGQSSVKLYCIRSLKLGRVEFHNVPVIPAALDSIGLGLLQHFEMILDLPGGRVTLTELDLDHSRFPLDASGLRVYFDDDRFMVYRVDPNSPAAAAGFLPGDQILQFAGWDPSKLWRHEIDETLARAGETIDIQINRDDVVQDLPLQLRRPYQYPPNWPPILPEFNPDNN